MQERGKIMDKDQVKEIIKDLRSKGLSLRKISSTLKEVYGLDISHVSVREYLKAAIPERPTEEAHVNDEEIASGVKPPEQVPVTTEKVVVEARPTIETKQEPVNEVVPRDPKENYKKYLEEARKRERLREERNRSIMAYILTSLTFGGLVLLLMLTNHWVI